jgi:hypothetical protein
MFEDDEEFDELDPDDEDELIDEAEDGNCPAASLTSIRLKRRRSHVEHRPPEQPVQTAPPSRSAVAPPPRPTDIVDYWSRLRNGRIYPAAGDLDAKLIVASWPNSILLSRCPGERGMRAAALFKPLGASAAAAQAGGERPVDFAPMVVEWVLALAEQTVQSGQPLAEKELFELPGGPARYAACTLPFSDDQARVDHVLCYVRALR